MKRAYRTIYRFLQSRTFFKITLVVFLLESAIIAVSAAYPQAFDENFHFGLIRIYSHYWLPFLSSQPPHANAYGAVARDPSYLYHYLMSFPYRIIAHIFHETIGQVIAMRFIDIGLFGAGLILFRRLLLRVGMSGALTNVMLFLFILIPIVPQLAAQVSYDDLMIPLTVWAVLLTFNAIDQLRARRPSIVTFAGLLALCLITTVVKDAFLPIFGAIVVYLVVTGFKAYRHQFKQLKTQLRSSWRAQSKLMRIALVILVIVSSGLVIQRDGVNLVQYHTLQPNCSRVLSVSACKAYSPWYFNYKNQTALANSSGVQFMNPLLYPFDWLYWMWYRLFFAVSGPAKNFKNYPPLPLPAAAAIIVGVVGIAAVIKWHRRILKQNPYMVLLALISLFYIGALVVHGYVTYIHTNVLENMNGRYLLPVLLLVAAIIGQALSFQYTKRFRAKIILTVVVIFLFLEGGGVLTFIDRSDPSWDISNPSIVKANNAARHITKKIVISGKKTYGTNYWFFN